MEEPDGIPEEQAEAKDLLRRVAACKPLARTEEQAEEKGLLQRMAAYNALAKGAGHMTENPQSEVAEKPSGNEPRKAGKQPEENPLAKVEEQLEENANQIDGILSNIPPVPEEKKAEKQPEHTASEHHKNPQGRVSFKAKLAEKMALIAKTHGASQEKEKKPPLREM